MQDNFLKKLKSSKAFYSSASFIITFIVYIITTAPDLTFTDAGELACVCATLGIAHPSGYPLFSILGYLWSLIPLPISTIHSLNIFAGFLTAASVAVFYFVISFVLEIVEKKFGNLNKKVQFKKTVKTPHTKSGIKESLIIKEKYSEKKSDNEHPQLTQTKHGIKGQDGILLISFALSLLYGFADTIWAQAVGIEVYSLHLLMINLIIFTFLKATFSDAQAQKYFWLASFLLGLSFTNHLTTILLVPALLFMYFKLPGEPFAFNKERFKALAILLIPLLIGLSLYIYMPVRSSTLPEFNWGWVHRSFSKFLYHLQGKQYQIWMFSGENVGRNILLFFSLVPYQVAWVGLIPFFYGLYVSFRISKELFWFLILLIITCLIYSVNYSIHDIDSYFNTAFFSILIITGIGVFSFVRKSPKYFPIIFILPIISLVINYAENDESDDYLVPEYTRILIDNLQPNAIIISSQWDYWCSAFWYKQQVEHYRPDVVLIEQELLRRTWFPEQLRRWYPETMKLCEKEMNVYTEELELFESNRNFDANSLQRCYITLLNACIDKNYNNRPIYITAEVLEKEPQLAKNYSKIPEGFAFRLNKLDEPNMPISIAHINLDKFAASLVGREGHLVDGIRQVTVMNFTNISKFAAANKQQDVADKAFQLIGKLNQGKGKK